ncbi:MAG: ergothioneine biosynthesis protein EgtC [Actinobacteria bacterium]|nr:ergothioneine biosynthesis protein EgtC [Actinomycetota bacterium]
MCRQLAYVGPPVTLASVVLDPPHSLLRQSYAPREQSHGVVNADGFGVGWYAPSVRSEPARYRTCSPIWSDLSFASFAPVVTTPALVASVRSASPPNPVEASGVAPFTSGPWLFAHNGAVEGYRSGPDGRYGVRPALTALVSQDRLAGLDGASDSELLFALTLDHFDSGDSPEVALTKTVAAVRDVAPARLNLMLCDGKSITATACGESLYVRQAEGQATVASEPLEDGAWEKLPDDSLVTASPASVKVSKL